MCIVIISLIDLLQSIEQLYFTLFYNIALKYIKIENISNRDPIMSRLIPGLGF